MSEQRESKPGHTPGPWDYDEESDNRNAMFAVRGSNGLSVADILPLPDPDIDGDERANARLIAAAPRMLALLKELDGGVFGIHPTGRFEQGYEKLQDARALIAEVEG